MCYKVSVAASVSISFTGAKINRTFGLIVSEMSHHIHFLYAELLYESNIALPVILAQLWLLMMPTADSQLYQHSVQPHSCSCNIA